MEGLEQKFNATGVIQSTVEHTDADIVDADGIRRRMLDGYNVRVTSPQNFAGQLLFVPSREDLKVGSTIYFELVPS